MHFKPPIALCLVLVLLALPYGLAPATAAPVDRLPPALAPGESLTSHTLNDGVQAMVHQTTGTAWQTTAPVHLLFYLLPNGNTIEQTFGRAASPGLDWHYQIQHVGAQTRRLRELLPHTNLVTIYLEAEGKSWPAWRSKRGKEGDLRIASIVQQFSAPYPHATLHLVSHSGGGSFLFGYLNSQDQLPENLQTLAFIDSNYAFQAEQHADKIWQWLQRVPPARLFVLAYDDRDITLNGKPVVSPTGGTFRATSRMSAVFETTSTVSVYRKGDFLTTTALERRLELRTHTNAENKILHTVLVEKNGLIQALGGHLFPNENWSGEQHYRKHIK